MTKIPESWERQPAEGDREWSAFQAFRDDRPPRSVRKARVSGVTQGEAYRWFHQYAWKERAAAYDAHRDKIDIETRDAYLRQHSKEIAAEHMQILKTARDLLHHEIELYLQTSLSSEASGTIRMSDLNRLMDNVIKYDRLVRDQPTEIVSSDDNPLRALGPEDLRKLAEIRKKMDQGGKE